jgi:hypothetical protein
MGQPEVKVFILSLGLSQAAVELARGLVWDFGKLKGTDLSVGKATWASKCYPGLMEPCRLRGWHFTEKLEL